MLGTVRTASNLATIYSSYYPYPKNREIRVARHVILRHQVTLERLRWDLNE